MLPHLEPGVEGRCMYYYIPQGNSGKCMNLQWDMDCSNTLKSEEACMMCILVLLSVSVRSVSV